MHITTHKLIWLIALGALLAAGGVAWLRGNVAEGDAPGGNPVAQVQAALDALAVDQLALNADTQAAVRAAAVAVEAGLVGGPEAHYVLAMQYQREMNVQAAEGLFKQAIAEAPEWSWPYAGLGSLLSRNSYGREEEAIEMLLKAIAIEPNWSKPHNSLAVLYRSLGYLDKAEVESREALRLDPGDVSVQNNFANLMVTLGRFQEAEEHYLQSIELNPEHPKPYYNLACLYALMDRADEALRYLDSAIKLAPLLRAEAAVDPDLGSLRDRPEYKELLGEVPAEVVAGAADTEAPADAS